ncbi:hypothetical protein [Actinoplanes subglobosus]|uniref:Uncharacterized protein n=1 Tax=Actinoplanes subglobosus TaxID=1547892 RepID=A0ABV8IPP8_9ACTN
MRQVYAHHATLLAAPGADPGAAITAAIGDLHPSRTHMDRDGEELRLRVLFATEPDRAEDVRGRIDAALAAGDWRLLTSGCARMDPADRPHGRRLLREGGHYTE